MKLTKKKLIYNILEVLFIGIAPLIFVIMQYGNIGNTKEAVGFRIEITGIMLAVIIFMIIKKVFINRKLADNHQQLNTQLADLKIETDSGKIANLEKSIKDYKTLEIVANAILPILFFVALVIASKALEQQLIKLSAVLVCITVSYIIGTVFGVLGAREITSKNRRTGNGK